MNITVNGNQVADTCGTANLEEVLVKLSRTAVPVNHMVSSVTVNGRHFTELYPGQSREISSTAIHDLSIGTVSLERFAAASMQDGALFLERIAAYALKTAELFRIYDETEANQHYAQLLDSLRSMFHFIDGLQKTLQWDFTRTQYQNEPVQKEWIRLTELIDELMKIQEEGDWILLADLIEYEMAPLLETWAKIFREKSRSTGV
jgi:hypothetical protein